MYKQVWTLRIKIKIIFHSPYNKLTTRKLGRNILRTSLRQKYNTAEKNIQSSHRAGCGGTCL
jgi:hypothetical protein